MASVVERGAPPLDAARKKQLQLFQKSLGLRFRSLALLNLAFSHRSYAHEAGEDLSSNERLEFLGDSVLGLAVASILYQAYPDAPEGTLSPLRSLLVSAGTLARIARRVHVPEMLLLSRGEDASGGRKKTAILADATEAIIGACYLDAGFAPAVRLVEKLVAPELDRVQENRHQRDAKTALQELSLARKQGYPGYRVIDRRGPDHARTFVVEVTVAGETYGPAEGRSKKAAEQQAAELALSALESAQSSDSAAGRPSGAELGEKRSR